MTINRSVAVIVALGFFAARLQADVLPPVQDTSSLNGKITLSTGKATTLTVSATRKGFVLFDLTGIPVSVLPTDITKARLRVYFPSVVKPGDITVHTVAAAWDEKNTLSEPPVDPSTIATFPAASVVAKKFLEVDVTSTVQAWHAGTATNNGFAFLAGAITHVTIGSKEGSGSGYPCELDLEIDRGIALALPFLRTVASMNGPSFLSANIIGGSTDNTVASGVTGVVIAGGGATNGFPQTISASYSSILGGYSNTIGANGGESTIGGGAGNTASGPYVTIAGGVTNTSSASYATIGGGFTNTASGTAATVGGGNTNTASGNGATVPGGTSNTASGKTSFAAGNRAKAIHDGAFVWGDSTNADVSSSANDQMTVRASGGVVINTSEMDLNASTGVALTVNASNAISVPIGTLYKDNTVVAWGRVTSNALAEGFNVASIAHNSAGNYTVVLKPSFTGVALLPVVSVSYIGAQPTTAAAFRFASINQLLSNTTFNVFINNGLFAAADADFTFIVTGR